MASKSDIGEHRVVGLGDLGYFREALVCYGKLEFGSCSSHIEEIN